MGQGKSTASTSRAAESTPGSPSMPALALQQAIDAHVASMHSVAAHQSMHTQLGQSSEPTTGGSVPEVPVAEQFTMPKLDLNRILQIAILAFIFFQLMVHHKKLVAKAKQLLKLKN